MGKTSVLPLEKRGDREKNSGKEGRNRRDEEIRSTTRSIGKDRQGQSQDLRKGEKPNYGEGIGLSTGGGKGLKFRRYV